MAADVKVVVVGAGAAGLAAAAELAHLGLSCQVLEAQPRLGGRVHSVTAPDGRVFERGAETINADMQLVLKLAARARLTRAALPTGGRDLCVLHDRVVARHRILCAETLDLRLQKQQQGALLGAAFVSALKALFQGAKAPKDAAVDPAPNLATTLDRLHLSPEDAAIAETMICEQYGAAPDALDTSALVAGLEAYDSDDTDMEVRFPAGMSCVIDALAAQLSQPPRLNTPVRAIVPRGQGVEVRTSEESWVTEHVIVAVPPPMARQIDLSGLEGFAAFDPLLQAFGSGDLIKTTLVYDRAFWRDVGLSGCATFAAPRGLEVVASAEDPAGGACLTAFLGGPVARSRAALAPETREALLLADLAAAFGPQAARPRQIDEAVWVDVPWCGGGYNATVRAGHCSDAAPRLAALRGPVVFAGAELDSAFVGYVEGALRSGRRAARAVAQDRRKVAA